MVIDNLLEKIGVKYEDLSSEEKETYKKWLSVLDTKPLTIEDVKFYLEQAKNNVSMELADCDEFDRFGPFKWVSRKHVGLKARLKNYLLLEAFLQSKEKAKNSLEKSLEQRLKA